jgi:O-antigen ligase
LVLVRPEYALTACVALVCGLVHPSLVPRLPAFGGALAAADAALAMSALYALWALATQPGQAPGVPVAGARLLAVAWGLFAVALVIAVTGSLALRELNPTHVLGETRDLIYVIMLPIAVIVLRSKVRQNRFVVSLVVLGCLFALGQVLQGVFKLPVFGAQGISVLETLGRTDDATTRATTLGLSVIIYALLLVVGAYALGALRLWVFIPVAGMLGLGIVLTYGRTTYAAVLLCVAVAVWWLNPRKLIQLSVLLLIVLAAGSALGLYFKPESFAAVVFRMTSIGDEINYGYSAQWRFWEFEAMLPHILEHPLSGIGLGADYKGLSGSAARPDLNRYMHNAYLYMAGKMGLPALGLFLLAMFSIFAIGRRTARGPAALWARVVGAASAAMVIRFLFASVTEPHLMEDYGVVIIAIAGALAYLSAQRIPPNASDSGVPQTGQRPSAVPWGRRPGWRR